MKILNLPAKKQLAKFAQQLKAVETDSSSRSKHAKKRRLPAIPTDPEKRLGVQFNDELYSNF